MMVRGLLHKNQWKNEALRRMSRYKFPGKIKQLPIIKNKKLEPKLELIGFHELEELHRKNELDRSILDFYRTCEIHPDNHPVVFAAYDVIIAAICEFCKFKIGTPLGIVFDWMLEQENDKFSSAINFLCFYLEKRPETINDKSLDEAKLRLLFLEDFFASTVNFNNTFRGILGELVSNPNNEESNSTNGIHQNI